MHCNNLIQKNTDERKYQLTYDNSEQCRGHISIIMLSMLQALFYLTTAYQLTVLFSPSDMYKTKNDE